MTGLVFVPTLRHSHRQHRVSYVCTKRFCVWVWWQWELVLRGRIWDARAQSWMLSFAEVSWDKHDSEGRSPLYGPAAVSTLSAERATHQGNGGIKGSCGKVDSWYALMQLFKADTKTETLALDNTYPIPYQRSCNIFSLLIWGLDIVFLQEDNLKQRSAAYLQLYLGL